MIPEIAKYKEQALLEYQGNPLIEALPNILNINEFTKLVSTKPLFATSERDLDASVRLHHIYRVLDYFQPFSAHFELEQKISRVIRRGYLHRNPLNPDYANKLSQINYLLKNSGKNSFDNLGSLIKTPSSATAFTMIGVSGVGKSTGVERILNLYPQVILHREHNGNPLHCFQIPWIKINCPHAGSLKALCTDFFIEVDRLLGTNYHLKFPSQNVSEDTMLAEMGLIAGNHNLGLLAVDELQDLSTSKSGGIDKMLNFFSKLVSQLGLPVIRIGTNKARSIMQGDLRHGRRAVGEGSMFWDRVKLKTEEDEELWHFFIKGFFKFQWTKKPTPYTNDFSLVLYNESQGIFDIALKLFMIAQWRAIATGIETISIEMVEKVAQDSLHFVRPMLDALKSGNQKLIDKYSDIRLDCDDEIFKDFKEKINKSIIKKLQSMRDLQESTEDIPNVLNKVIYNLLELGIPPKNAKSLAEEVIINRKSEVNVAELTTEAYKMALRGEGAKLSESSVKEPVKPEKLKKKKSYIDGDLRFISDEAKKLKLPVYEVLQQNSVIKSPIVDFYKNRKIC
jgi:AAA domain